ncbi:MAG: protein-disulfide reductase DsbD family protein [Akkermansiaceae bacterium]
MKALIWLSFILGATSFTFADVKDIDPFDDQYNTPPPADGPGGFSIAPLDGKPIPVEEAQSTSSVLSSVTAFKPGVPFYVSLKLTHPQGWHSYYVNSGGPSGPVLVDWKLPDGWKASKLIYPIPHLSPSAIGANYDYSGTNHFLTEITPPSDIATGTKVTLNGEARWQICTEKNCVQEPSPFDPLPLIVSVTASEETELSAAADEIIAAADATAQKSSAWSVAVRNLGQQIELILTPEDGAVSELKDVYFFADQPNLTNSAAKQTLTKTDDGYILRISKVTGEDAVKDFDYATLGGILKAKSGWEANRDFKALAVTHITVGEVDPSELYTQISIGELLATLGFMFLGGMILNLMPCVFPVIGLKIMGFVNQAGEDKKKIVLHGLAFVVGVLMSFWIIAGILLFFREAALSGGGEVVGWGYQLQQAPVVWILMLIMFVLGLSMFGLFEIGAGATSVGSELQNKNGLTGTFFSGVLATVVATPCSAPFLGPAIGLAVKLPPVEFMLAFSAMALGLGAPYLILSIFPNLVKKLPRPGPWMESFKQGMSFLLFGTAGFLLWVYMDLNDPFHGPSIVVGLTAIALAAWIYGRWFLPHKSARARSVGIGFAVIFLIGGLYASRPYQDNSWDDWSQEKVEAALAQGRPVYVDFTAKWCVTCQSNKKVAYTSEVKKALKDRNVLLLRADKTKPSPDIEKALAELNRTAIPVNALYVPDREENPTITPEVLTPGYLLELIETEVPQSE